MRCHSLSGRRIVSGDGRQIERCTGGTASGSTDRRCVVLSLFGCSNHCLIAERPRRTRSIRLQCGIEYVRAASWIAGRRRSIAGWHWRGLRWSGASLRAHLLEAVVGVVLHPLELHLKLLIPVLQLFDGAGQLAQRVFHAVEPDREIAGIALGNATLRLRLWGLTRLSRRLTAAEEIIKEIARRPLFLRPRGA